MWSIRSESEADTREQGRRLAAAAEAGLVVCLQGTLGAGKTCFAQGVGAGLGVEDDVVSPTFMLMMEHDAHRLPLLHVDLYRLDSYAELHNIGFEEQLDEWPGVSLVEWGDRFSDALPEDCLWVTLQILASSSGSQSSEDQDGQRQIEVHASGPIARRVLARWRGHD